MNRVYSLVTGIGVTVFLVIVVLLHFVQRGYDPLVQFMSELALGKFGALLVTAFIGLSAAAAATAANIRVHGAPQAPAALLSLAAACFLGAGLVTLATSAPIHILFVASAFILCGLTMYLLPLTVAAFAAAPYRLASWGSCVAMAAPTGLGGSVLLPGVAQRLSAAGLLVWLLLVAWRLGLKPVQHEVGN